MLEKFESINWITKNKGLSKDEVKNQANRLLKKDFPRLDLTHVLKVISISEYKYIDSLTNERRVSEKVYIPILELKLKLSHAKTSSKNNSNRMKSRVNSKEVKRLNPTNKTREKLYLLSRNQCAFPDCTQKLMDDSGQLIGEICHIEAANEGGERFNPAMTNETRRHISNLVVLCRNHHAVTNNEKVYSVEKMKQIKKNHEEKKIEADEPLVPMFLKTDLFKEIAYPENLEKLPLTELERTDEFLQDAREIMDTIASLPLSTRSFYAHALFHSSKNDISLSFDPRELEERLRIKFDDIFKHAQILEKTNLLSELDNDDYPTSVKFWFVTPSSKEDYQMYFLCLLKDLSKSSAKIFFDIIENSLDHLVILFQCHCVCMAVVLI